MTDKVEPLTPEQVAGLRGSLTFEGADGVDTIHHGSVAMFKRLFATLDAERAKGAEAVAAAERIRAVHLRAARELADMRDFAERCVFQFRHLGHGRELLAEWDAREGA